MQKTTKKRKTIEKPSVTASHSEFFSAAPLISDKQISEKLITDQPSLHQMAKTKWSFMKADLQSALGEWSDLEDESQKKSPEDEQLDKVKTLIEDLKLKLSDF